MNPWDIDKEKKQCNKIIEKKYINPWNTENGKKLWNESIDKTSQLNDNKHRVDLIVSMF